MYVAPIVVPLYFAVNLEPHHDQMTRLHEQCSQYCCVTVDIAWEDGAH